MSTEGWRRAQRPIRHSRVALRVRRQRTRSGRAARACGTNALFVCPVVKPAAALLVRGRARGVRAKDATNRRRRQVKHIRPVRQEERRPVGANDNGVTRRVVPPDKALPARGERAGGLEAPERGAHGGRDDVERGDGPHRLLVDIAHL